jgi:hypothetical protein
MRDIGLQIINDLFRSLRIDRQWSQTIERGFRWWPGPLAQTCWVEPCFEDRGHHLARLHIRSDFVADIPAAPKVLAQLGVFMRYAGLSGLLYHPERPGCYQLAASLYIHEQTREWLTRVASLVAACQVAEAHIMAEELTSMLGGQPDHSAHPTSGMRKNLDSMTEVLQSVAADGRHHSLYQGDGMLAALDMLAGSQFEANGDEGRLVVEFPFGAETSRLIADTTESNPRIGHGLLMHLTLPVGWGADVSDPRGTQSALGLNRRELTELTGAHFLGSWCPTEEGLTFISFFPNTMAGINPGCVSPLVQSATCRARWAAGVFHQPFDPHQAQTGREAMLDQIRHMTEQEIRQVAANLPPGQDAQAFLQFVLAMKRTLGQPENRDGG